MQGVHVALLVVLLAVGAYIGHQVWLSNTLPTMSERVAREVIPHEELTKHTKEFKREVVKVTDNIYLAIGYALGNAIMLIAPEGLIIVDVTESNVAAKLILDEFRKVTNKPIKALIYTHHHTDHTGGAAAFIEDPNNPPDIWAHASLPNEINKFHTSAFGAKLRRTLRQFGVFVKQPLNAGLGARLRFAKKGESFGYVYPNKFVDQTETDVQIAGLNLKIIHIPGETSDQIGVWVPDWKAFMCGDDIYRAFPNIYTIRGAPARDPVDWYLSIQRMLDLEPEHLVPSHTQPISGKEKVRDLLEAYRDGIQYVHDQALRFINKGYTPDDVVKHVKLPNKLALHSHLREYYGTVPWSVKGVYQLYLGWFSGDPVDLFPLSSSDKAPRIVSLAGGVANVVGEAIKAWNNNDIQWALELASYVLEVDKNNKDAKQIKIDCLNQLSGKQINSIARNYFLTSALEEMGELKLDFPDSGRADLINSLPVLEIFHLMSSMFKPEVCGSKKEVVLFEFQDTKTTISIQLRNSVAIVRADKIPQKVDIKITTKEAIFKDMLLSKMKTIGSYKSDEMKVEGSLSNFKDFLECFEQSY